MSRTGPRKSIPQTELAKSIGSHGKEGVVAVEIKGMIMPGGYLCDIGIDKHGRQTLAGIAKAKLSKIVIPHSPEGTVISYEQTVIATGTYLNNTTILQFCG